MTGTSYTGRVFADRWECGPLFEHALSANSKLWTHTGRDRSTGGAVLIVTLRPEWARDPAIRGEYAWGLDQIATLDHPGIVAIRARHVDEAAGEVVFVTELLPWHSHSLARTLGDGAVFTEAQAVDLARLALDALGHAHGRGVVFGNVKPSNLLVTPARDRVVLNGLPKPPFQFSSIPQLGAYLGKPFACAPELIATGTFDARADLYGLGLVLYEIAAGRLPFRVSDNLGVFFGSIIHDALPPVTELNPDVSGKLADVIARAVAKDPAARYASAAEMSAALAKVQPRAAPLLTRERLATMIATTFPAPLAHAYAAIGAQTDDVARLQRVVDCAHACITFIGAIVAAARHRDKLEPIADDAARASFARPSLGHWVALVREGTRAPLSLAVADLMWTRGKPSGAARAIDALVALRNEIRHGSTPSAAVARKRLAEALPQLERLLAELVFLRDYRLVIPRRLDFTGDDFACEVDVLRGTQLPERRTIQLAEPASVGKVYLGIADLAQLVPLAPLVTLATCPICEDDELFVYESASDERVHYVSYGKGHGMASEDAAVTFRRHKLL